MSHEVGTIRISRQGRDQLIKLKRATGIKNWNVLCRWALCVSLADATIPIIRGDAGDSNIEMSWRTFSGSESTALLSLLTIRAEAEARDIASVAHSHIHRGIGHLAGVISRDGSIEDLLRAVTQA